LLRRHKIKNQLRIGCSVCRESLESLSFYLKSQLKVLSNALAPFYFAGRMVYILPAKEKKKTGAGSMFSIIPALRQSGKPWFLVNQSSASAAVFCLINQLVQSLLDFGFQRQIKG
jgi:hypothetical protein